MQLYPAAVSQWVLAFAGVQSPAQEPPTHSVPIGQAAVVPLDKHAPAPLHVPSVVNLEWASVGQVVGVAAVHTDPLHCSHVLLAVHFPSSPHPLLAVGVQSAWGSTTPAPTPRQTPSRTPDAFFTLQAWQVPQVADAQQVPSTHCPLAH